jgi:hypothetical protein
VEQTVGSHLLGCEKRNEVTVTPKEMGYLTIGRAIDWYIIAIEMAKLTR